MLDSSQYRNYEVRAYLSLFFLYVCVSVSALCLSYKQRRIGTAVTVSNEHVYVAFDFCLSYSCFSLYYVGLSLACSCALWQQKRGDASVNVYCMRVWWRCDCRVINTKHLDTDPTSAALREVDGASRATGETLMAKEEKSEEKKCGNRELELAKTNWCGSLDNEIKIHSTEMAEEMFL